MRSGELEGRLIRVIPGVELELLELELEKLELKMTCLS